MSVKLTAQDFKDPLFKVLGDLTNKKADLPIDLKMTYQPICQIMGITLDQFGNDPSTTNTRVEKWIQWAFRDFKNDGYTKTMGRGQWALTEAGVKFMTSQATPTQSPPTSQPDVSANDTSEIVVSFTKIKPEDAYHEDAYIRTLALQETPCAGAYSQQSPTCQECTLNSACMNAMMTELVNISQELAKEDAEEEKRKQKKMVSANPNVSTKPPRVDPNGSGDLVLIHQSSVCSKCGKAIPKGTKAYWVPATATGDSGLYHSECFK